MHEVVNRFRVSVLFVVGGRRVSRRFALLPANRTFRAPGRLGPVLYFQIVDGHFVADNTGQHVDHIVYGFHFVLYLDLENKEESVIRIRIKNIIVSFDVGVKLNFTRSNR